MAIVDLIMPKMGESIMEATILKWHKQPGDQVKQDESVLDIATDKVDTEVPSTAAGTLEEILFQVNDVVPVGAVIARIKTNSPETARKEEPSSPAPATFPKEQAAAIPPEPKMSSYSQNGNMTANRFYSPLVLNIASNEGVPMSELEKIPGTGNEGRVTKKDILQYVSDRPLRPGGHAVYGTAGGAVSAGAETLRTAETADTETVVPDESAFAFNGNTEIIEMDRMRKLIADHMVRSKQTSAHVTSFTEADVTNLVKWRESAKEAFEKRENTKLTLTPLFIQAVIRCIKKYPLINSSLQGTKIILKKDINIGMATALPSGNLIVPVIKNADNYNLTGLARQVNSLAANARSNKLKAEDVQDGTFTLTNVGVFGSLMGTPIINQPQVAILAVGAVKKRPVVIETAQGDSIAIRHMMYLSMSYDHRIIDGSLGATFLTEVAKELENFNPNRD
jgi:2-oxoglutarate dehydrogenase E2 component (dihydrolipoamide succinyltransferase)